MFNVCTEEGKVSAAREYRARILIAACLFVAVEFSLAGVGGLFSYFALTASRHSVSGTESISPEVAIDTQSLDTFKARLALLAAPSPTLLYPGVVALAEVRGVGIRLVSFAAERSPEGDGWRMVVNGIADTRAALAAFERRLAAHSSFTAVELPVESFAHERDAPFTVRANFNE